MGLGSGEGVCGDRVGEGPPSLVPSTLLLGTIGGSADLKWRLGRKTHFPRFLSCSDRKLCITGLTGRKWLCYLERNREF